MNGENVIKFGKAKKELARKTKEKKAEENRVKYGRTKAEKRQDEMTASKLSKHIDSHKRDE